MCGTAAPRLITLVLSSIYKNNSPAYSERIPPAPSTQERPLDGSIRGTGESKSRS
jgi:hypothetical protein